MKKAEQIKRKHHYVWGYYLKQWSFNNRDVNYLTPNGNIACNSVNGLTQELDFYKINLLTQEDVDFIKTFYEKSPHEIKESWSQLLKDFFRMSQIVKRTREAGLSPPEKIATAFKTFEHNALENLHSMHEKDALKTMKALNTGDFSVMDQTENMLSFLAYFGVQVMRTKAVLDRSKAAVQDFGPPYSLMERYKSLLNKNWWFLSYCLGTNVGASLYVTRKSDHHVLLENQTNEPFITSDVPIINVHETTIGLRAYEAPEQADFYYPISPNYAYMINQSCRYPRGRVVVTETDAKNFNNRMFQKSHEYVFAETKEQIEEIQRRNKSGSLNSP